MALNWNSMFLFEYEKRVCNDKIKPRVIHLPGGFVTQKNFIKMLPTKPCIQQKIPCSMDSN